MVLLEINFNCLFIGKTFKKKTNNFKVRKTSGFPNNIE